MAYLSLLPDNVQDAVDELSSLGIVTLGPVVAGPALAEHKVVGPEELPEGPAPDAVHGPGLQVHKDGAGYVLSCSLVSIKSQPWLLLGTKNSPPDASL